MSGRFYSGTPDREREKEEAAERKRQAYNPFNTDETVVIEAEYFSFYKGSLVIKLPFMDTAAFSYGVIFAGPDIDAQTINHEYGHFLHLCMIGRERYAYWVLVPSLIDFWGGKKYDAYYSEPQEYIADYLGNVARTYTNGSPYQYTISGAEAMAYFIYTILP